MPHTTDTNPPATVADLLRWGWSRIETKGWEQGAYSVFGGGFCTLGAIQHGQVFGPVYMGAQRILERVLTESLGEERQACVIDWNDADDRTVDDVRALYWLAIEAASSGAPL